MRASPVLLRKLITLLISLMVCTSAFAQPLLIDVDSTPYDNQMNRIRPVLASVAFNRPDTISLAVVNQWMTRLRKLRYRYSAQWQTPEEVSIARSADCKGKALAMYQVMQWIGAKNVRFVIGRHHAGDWFTHAWLEWSTADGNFVLDPTFNGYIVKADARDSSKYIPLYAYEGMQRFRAVNAPLAPTRPLPVVASGGRNPFAARYLYPDCRVR